MVAEALAGEFIASGGRGGRRAAIGLSLRVCVFERSLMSEQMFAPGLHTMAIHRPPLSCSTGDPQMSTSRSASVGRYRTIYNATRFSHDG